MESKNIVIIGGSSGIGFSISQKLIDEGYNVYAFSRNKPALDHPNLNYTFMDVSQSLKDINFPDIIHGLLYMPGTIELKPFRNFSEQDFMDDYQVNLLGAVKVIQKAFPGLKKSKDASIILFSTVAVQRGMPFHSLVASSKGAVEGFARSIAAEFAPAIRVNVIAPSITDTPLASSLLANEKRRQLSVERHPLKKIGTPNDISNAALFLLSEKSSWITGQVLHVDGGLSTL